jgi:hypothetical protein
MRDPEGIAAAPAARCRNWRRENFIVLPPYSTRVCMSTWRCLQAQFPNISECSPAAGTVAAVEFTGLRHVPPTAHD